MGFCAAILAGGLGTRLRTVVDDRPKVMALVAGRPFIIHLLEQLSDGGISQVVLCTGYLSDLVRKELGDTYNGMELIYSVEESPLGTGGALRHASGLLAGDTVLVLNGDSYCHCSVGAFTAGWLASRALAGMALARVEDVSRYGAVLTNEFSRVETFVEKGCQAGPGWINAGLYLLPADLIRRIEPDRPVSLEQEIIPQLVDGSLFGYHCPGPFIDIGVPEEYERAQQFFSVELKGKP
jgi:D-glycero-alpha-D-manno-heptose 1-phosphate guanylyltransferase